MRVGTLGQHRGAGARASTQRAARGARNESGIKSSVQQAPCEHARGGALAMGAGNAHRGVTQLQQPKRLRISARGNIFLHRRDKLRVIRFRGGRGDHQFAIRWKVLHITHRNLKSFSLQSFHRGACLAIAAVHNGAAFIQQTRQSTHTSSARAHKPNSPTL